MSFDKDIQAKSVTLEGDIIDPAGTLTGGILSPLYLNFYISSEVPLHAMKSKAILCLKEEKS